MSLQIFFTLKPIFRHEQGSKPEINEVTISDICVNQLEPQTSTERLETLQTLVSGGMPQTTITQLFSFKVPNSDIQISIVGNEDAGLFGENSWLKSVEGATLTEDELQWLGWVPPLPHATPVFGTLAICKDNGTDYESFTQEEAMLVLEAITTRTIEVI